MTISKWKIVFFQSTEQLVGYMEHSGTNVELFLQSWLKNFNNVMEGKDVSDTCLHMTSSCTPGLQIGGKNCMMPLRTCLSFLYNIQHNAAHPNIGIKWKIPFQAPFTKHFQEYLIIKNLSIALHGQ